MKRLICEADVHEHIRQGNKVITVDACTMITPSAKDAAIAHGIEVCFENDGACMHPSPTAANTCSDKGIDSEVIYRAMNVLASKGLLDDFVDGGCAALEPCACAAPARPPYSAQTDPAGLKIVQGGSVQMEFLETGNPQNDVHFQELISSTESQVMNAGFLEINGCSFDWEVGCDEMYYVIQGPLSITVNGTTYTAQTGDVVNLPVGSTVVFRAPGKARMFYGIKAA